MDEGALPKAFTLVHWRKWWACCVLRSILFFPLTSSGLGWFHVFRHGFHAVLPLQELLAGRRIEGVVVSRSSSVLGKIADLSLLSSANSGSRVNRRVSR